MQDTNTKISGSQNRGRKRSFSRTSSFAFWALAALILIGLASYASLSLFSAPTTSAVTTVPTKLNFQGRLTDSAGTVKPSGTYNMRFKLFTVASGGTNVWAEDRLVSASQGVTVTNGQFSVQLGSVTALPASLFASGALYLEVELPTPATATTSSPSWTEGAMTPRNQMATSAYAYNSETLDGQDGDYYLNAGNLTGTVSSARLSGSYTGITGTGALAAGSIASGFGTIATNNTISGTILSSTVATGTAPLTVTSTTKVTNLNVDLLDGLDSSAFAQVAANNTFTGTNTFRNTTDTTSAFTVQDATSASMFNVSTSDDVITLGTSGNFDTMTKLTNPTTLPAGTSYDTAFSPDGQYMSVAHATTPFVTIYKRSGNTFTKLANPAILPTSTGKGTAFSPDGKHLIVLTTATPYITIYERSGDTFTKLTDPATLPAGSSDSVAFSPDSQYMSVAHTSSPHITIYKRSGNTFTKLADPAILPPGQGMGTAFSPDGQYMSVAHLLGSYITIYKRSGDTFTKLADPATLPPVGGAYDVTFSPDSRYMSVAHVNTPYITIYKRSGDTFTKLANPAILPAGDAEAAVFSPDGKYMAVGHANTPYVTMYKRSDDTFTKLANPATLPTWTSYNMAFSPDSQYMSVAHNSSPYITIYKASGQTVRTDLNGTLNVTSDINTNSLSVVSGLQVQGTAMFANDLMVGNTASATTFQADDGLQVAPSYSFARDPGTGMWMSAAGTLYFSEAGSTVLRFGSTTSFLLGTTQRTQRLCHSNGDAPATALLTNVGDCSTGGSDFAEYYGSPGNVPQGTIVQYDKSRPLEKVPDPTEPGRMGNKAFVKTATDRSKALGVHSTNPYIDVLGKEYYSPGDNIIPIGLAGRVPVRVDTSNGPIEVGDPITLSATPGVGARAIDAGQIIGYSMQGFSGEGEGTVVVLVSTGYWAPSDLDSLQGQSATYNDLQVNGTATLAALNVTGASTLTELVVTGNTTLRGTLTVEKDVSILGNLTVKNAEFTGTITANGHIVSSGSAPTAETGTALGIATAEPSSAAVATVDGTDGAGTIKVVAGGQRQTTGVIARITFAEAYSTSYKVVLSATNEHATDLRVYLVKTATGFDVVSKDVPVAGATYEFDYVVMGAKAN